MMPPSVMPSPLVAAFARGWIQTDFAFPALDPGQQRISDELAKSLVRRCPSSVRPYFITRIGRDPDHARALTDGELTWLQELSVDAGQGRPVGVAIQTPAPEFQCFESAT